MIYENIRNLREDHDKTQKELAEYLNVKQTTYSKYELGKINIPVEILIRLADYYNVSVDLNRPPKVRPKNLTIGRSVFYGEI